MTIKTLDDIVTVLEQGAQFAELIPVATLPATVADQFLKIALASIRAHEAATGKPWDASLLAPVTPA